MEKKDARKGMKVVFGRSGSNAEKSLGKIVKINPARAKVELLEERGTRRQYTVGSQFGVPYSLMEPAPENGDKTNVEIGGHSKITPGKTTFRSAYADSNPLWKVVSKVGNNVWLCEVVDEPIEINGRMVSGDYTGMQKTFMTREIEKSLLMSQFIEDSLNKSKDFYASLTPGQIIHYDNGFNNWVRCEVVQENGENRLKPIALVGDWKKYDLPRRMQDGSIHRGYHAEKIETGETFKPNQSNLFESGKIHGVISLSTTNTDPTVLEPISLDVPEMTEDEAHQAKLWQKIKEIHEITGANHGDPEAILNLVMNHVAAF